MKAEIVKRTMAIVAVSFDLFLGIRIFFSSFFTQIDQFNNF